MTYRTHTCGELGAKDVHSTVVICGWIQTIRALGNITFIDLRDRYGITQLLVHPRILEAQAAGGLGREYVIRAEGTVVERKNKNDKLPTGSIEIEVRKLDVLNASKTPPFTILDETDGGDDLRMQYRYLDLRRNVLQKNMELRHRVIKIIRNYLEERNFNEIETPFLIKSTPEGARDFVIPSRMNPALFYALPQSPQIFKQLLMVAGYDRYFQIARCFRDEDLRADRQPEFTQLDCEMSFVSEEDIFRIFEDLIVSIIRQIKNVSVPTPIPRMTYDEAMKNYGSDKPDMRFEMKIQNLKEKNFAHLPEIVASDFDVFKRAESILGLVIPGGAALSRKEIDAVSDWIKRPQIGMKGLSYLRYKEGQANGSIDKFFTPEILVKIATYCKMKDNDALFLLADTDAGARKAAGELRLEMGRKMGLIDESAFSLLWVTDFPLFARNEENDRWDPSHHPFTSPKAEDIEKLYASNDFSGVKAQAYDMALNGMEIGGGSIRIHDRKLQERIFSILKLSPEEIENRFGFMLRAFEYGAPPHGGIAFGLDRLCAILCGADSIRDVIAFPKNNRAQDTMLDAPSSIDQSQLDELHIAIKKSASRSH